MKAQKNTGFTLVEAIVTLAVVAIITTLAMPSFTNLLNKRRISASAHTLYSGLQEARSVAVSEGTQVSTCLSADGLQCTSNLAQGSSGHFISFRGTTVPTAGTWDTVGIRAVPIDTQAGKISLSKFGGPSTQVQFQADGITLNSAQNGSFTLLGSDNTMTQKVVVARTGRVSIQ